MTIESLLTLAGIIIGSNGLWTYISMRRSNKSADHRLLIALAHDRLYQLCAEYIAQGWIDKEAFESVTELYEAYHAAGGNGTGTALYDKVKALPLKDILGGTN